MSKGLKIALAVIDVIFAIGAFSFGGVGIVGGLLMLCAAFLVSPLPEKVPALVNQKTGLFSVIAFVVGLIFMIAGAPATSETDNSSPDSQPVVTGETTTNTQPEDTTTEVMTDAVSSETTTDTENTTTVKITETERHTDEQSSEDNSESGATLGELNALRAAQSYIDTMAFSYSSLIKQLEFSQYSHDEAVYAADHCGADWNAEALEAAQNYIDTMAFSYSGLLKQMNYEGFTKEQSAYGADNCGADWNAEAAESAQNYMDTMPMSKGELENQLKYEGFTDEQVKAGLAAVGY